MAYEGFPKETVAFLRAIDRNNDKSWFEDHRSEYENYWLEPAREFVDAVSARLQKIAPVAAEPRVNGSIFRINRDVRFSKDKTPYKNHLDFWFWEGERRQAVTGFYMRIGPKDLGLGAGSHGLQKEHLTTYRDRVVEPDAGKALVKAVKSVERAGFSVSGEHYKTVPRGYEPESDLQARLLRYNALWCGGDEPIPNEVYSKDIVSYVIARWRKFAPIHRWLVANVQGS